MSEFDKMKTQYDALKEKEHAHCRARIAELERVLGFAIDELCKGFLIEDPESSDYSPLELAAKLFGVLKKDHAAPTATTGETAPDEHKKQVLSSLEQTKERMSRAMGWGPKEEDDE